MHFKSAPKVQIDLQTMKEREREREREREKEREGHSQFHRGAQQRLFARKAQLQEGCISGKGRFKVHRVPRAFLWKTALG